MTNARVCATIPLSMELEICGVYANLSIRKDEHNIVNYFIIWNKEFNFGKSIGNVELVT